MIIGRNTGSELNRAGFPSGKHEDRQTPYRGTSRTGKCTPLGPYRRPILRVLGGGLGRWAFSYGRGIPIPRRGKMGMSFHFTTPSSTQLNHTLKRCQKSTGLKPFAARWT